MPRRQEPRRSKSAIRVLEMLDYFTAERPQATVMEIARAYGYPQSSTSELMSCLVEMGYLRRDLRARTYRPSARVAMLGSWVHPRLFREGKLFPMMDELARQIAAPVVIGGIVGLRVQTFQTVGRPPAEIGALEADADSLLHSAMGKLLLSTLDRNYVRKLVHRLNAEAEPDHRVRIDDLLAELDQIRGQGFACSAALAAGGAGLCAVLLPQNAADEPLALGAAVTTWDAPSVEALVRAIRTAVAGHLGPMLAHSRSPLRPHAQAS